MTGVQTCALPISRLPNADEVEIPQFEKGEEFVVKTEVANATKASGAADKVAKDAATAAVAAKAKTTTAMTTLATQQDICIIDFE